MNFESTFQFGRIIWKYAKKEDSYFVAMIIIVNVKNATTFVWYKTMII